MLSVTAHPTDAWAVQFARELAADLEDTSQRFGVNRRSTNAFMRVACGMVGTTSMLVAGSAAVNCASWSRVRSFHLQKMACGSLAAAVLGQRDGGLGKAAYYAAPARAALD